MGHYIVTTQPCSWKITEPCTTLKPAHLSVWDFVLLQSGEKKPKKQELISSAGL